MLFFENNIKGLFLSTFSFLYIFFKFILYPRKKILKLSLRSYRSCDDTETNPAKQGQIEKYMVGNARLADHFLVLKPLELRVMQLRVNHLNKCYP